MNEGQPKRNSWQEVYLPSPLSHNHTRRTVLQLLAGISVLSAMSKPDQALAQIKQFDIKRPLNPNENKTLQEKVDTPFGSLDVDYNARNQTGEFMLTTTPDLIEKLKPIQKEEPLPYSKLTEQKDWEATELRFVLMGLINPALETHPFALRLAVGTQRAPFGFSQTAWMNEEEFRSIRLIAMLCDFGTITAVGVGDESGNRLNIPITTRNAPKPRVNPLDNLN